MCPGNLLEIWWAGFVDTLQTLLVHIFRLRSSYLFHLHNDTFVIFTLRCLLCTMPTCKNRLILLFQKWHSKILVGRHGGIAPTTFLTAGTIAPWSRRLCLGDYNLPNGRSVDFSHVVEMTAMTLKSMTVTQIDWHSIKVTN